MISVNDYPTPDASVCARRHSSSESEKSGRWVAACLSCLSAIVLLTACAPAPAPAPSLLINCTGSDILPACTHRGNNT